MINIRHPTFNFVECLECFIALRITSTSTPERNVLYSKNAFISEIRFLVSSRPTSQALYYFLLAAKTK